jgi:hypothetical protein
VTYSPTLQHDAANKVCLLQEKSPTKESVAPIHVFGIEPRKDWFSLAPCEKKCCKSLALNQEKTGFL